jgi:anti-sigma regulatory factor (Ser/Thr protein kinase)
VNTLDDCLKLESDPSVVALAREFVRDRLEHWQATDQIEYAVLVATELVTNAVLHARTQIHLTVSVDESRVRVEVYDENTRLPTVAAIDPDATSGRGLALVAAVARSWGIEHHPHGKVVWAEIGEPGVSFGNERLDLRRIHNVDQVLQEVDRTSPSGI